MVLLPCTNAGIEMAIFLLHLMYFQISFELCLIRDRNESKKCNLAWSTDLSTSLPIVTSF